MKNLEWLFDTNADFHGAVCKAAAEWLGSTSTNFADSWLRETHRECVQSDYEDLRGQHADARDGDADDRQLFVLDEHNMRRLYHIGFMDCKDGHYNTPAHGLNNIEFLALSDYENGCQYHEQEKRKSVSVDESDTREKLEADVHKQSFHEAMPAGGRCWMIEVPESTVINWIDRQAAITEHECEEEHRTRLTELHDLLDEAARERKALRDELIEYKHSHPDAPNKPISRFDAQKSAENAESGATTGDMRNFDATVDTREKLEADILKYYTHSTSTVMFPPSVNIVTKYISVSLDMVLGWLNRQAAITERECHDGWCYECQDAHDRQQYANVERINKLQDALNKAAGNWAHANALLQGLLEECENCPDTGCTQYVEEVVKPNLRTTDKAVAAMPDYKVNPDGLPVGLTISNDGTLLNWCGENYVKQAEVVSLGRYKAELSKRDKGIERLKRSRDALKEERDKLMERLTEERTLPSVIELEEALRERDELKRERALMDDELDELEKERDTYRELCGRFRRMANDMLNMEVD